MADSAHLEKMGRELKCPICLSLLNTAVSLSCNHVFCNFCILKSMKADSHCPVCKVPYQRREIRPAPHMDNLVSIYKSMEVASGINIFVSQTAKKSEEGQNRVHGTSIFNRPETDSITCGKRKKQSTKGKGPRKELSKTNSENSDPQLSAKPSFPSKKRVHVPQDLLSETPMRPKKCERSDKSLVNRLDDHSIVLKEKNEFLEKGEPVLSPFFWLQEQDDNDGIERLNSQQTDVDHVSDSPQYVPCFSDIKDSDDESPTKMTNSVKECSQDKVTNFFDSEMFEWTQRACSPELCLTPVRSQVAYHDEFSGSQEKNCKVGSQYLTANEGEEKGSENTDMKELSPKNRIVQNRTKKSVKCGKRSTGKANRKHDLSLTDEIQGILPSDMSKIAEDLSAEAEFPTDTSSKSPNSLKRTCKRNKRGRPSANATTGDAAQQEDPTDFVEANISNNGDENVGKVLVSFSEENSKTDRNVKPRRSNGMNNIKCKRNSRRSSKRVNDNFVAADLHNKSLINQHKVNENAEDIGTSILENTTSLYKIINTQIQNDADGGLRNQKKLKLSADDDAQRGLVNDDFSEPPMKKTQNSMEPHKDDDITSDKNSKTTKKVLSTSKKRTLQKCENTPTQIQCAFCQSSTNSEASGEMMHYVNGKPVAPDYNGGSNIIHSHRNCTEWAPNVYFEDDNVINLEAELTRSRRIRCSCCGNKGAALGCYEKSCRKSFHVPCAKLVPQCRWDTENFVMLCPLHPSVKLPKENFRSQGNSMKKSVARPQTQQAEVNQNKTTRSWISEGQELSKKCVICCSGLSTEEKDIVTKFKRLAGVLMVKNYGPKVTHIISSTDENGACRRTLKFLMGILEGKWILKIDWVKACMDASKLVAEEQFEIKIDIHGVRDGPRIGRRRLLNKEPKLFSGLKFYFTGEFIPSYKGYLQDLVVAGGGAVLHRKPISNDQSELPYESSSPTTFIIYNAQPPESRSGTKTLDGCGQSGAVELASSTGAKVASNFWILDSIAACKLQEL